MDLENTQTPPTDSHTNIRMGWIQYWNLFPVYSELRRRLGDRLNLVGGHPAQINQMLKDNLIDLAPSSSYCLVKHPGNASVIPFGVAASRAVNSVYWGLAPEHMTVKAFMERRLEEIRSIFNDVLRKNCDSPREAAAQICGRISRLSFDEGIAAPLVLSRASDTSNALSRILFMFFFGRRKYLECMKHGVHLPAPGKECDGCLQPMQLLIGDEALERRPQFYKVVDLAKLWKEMTGLPFVFAVWQSRHAIHTDLVSKLQEACLIAQRRMRIDPGAYLEEVDRLGLRTGGIDLKDYWQRIEYKLEDAHIKGLKLFLALCKEVLMTKSETDYLLGLPSRESNRQLPYS